MVPVPGRPPAPALELRDMEGRRHRLADYSGKVVVVNYWATWCPPCREEMPSLQRFWARLRERGVMLLAIDVGESAPAVRAFLRRVPVDFAVLLDPDSKTTLSWPVKGLPTTYVVDPKGRLIYRVSGVVDWDDPAVSDLVRSLAPATPTVGDGPQTPPSSAPD